MTVGMAMLARIAVCNGPRWNHTSRWLVKSVATTCHIVLQRTRRSKASWRFEVPEPAH